MLREVLLLGKLKHTNVVDYKHAWLENRQIHRFGPEVPCLFILMVQIPNLSSHDLGVG
jgi:hypothetical protein